MMSMSAESGAAGYPCRQTKRLLTHRIRRTAWIGSDFLSNGDRVWIFGSSCSFQVFARGFLLSVMLKIRAVASRPCLSKECRSRTHDATRRQVT